MTEDRFTELVNLYLDKEISQRELAELKSELASNAERKAEFQERERLHQAMRMALNPEASKRRRSSSRSRSGQKRSSSSSSSRGRSKQGVRSTRITQIDERVQGAHQTAGLPRWVLGSGLAASLLIGLLVLPPVFRDTTDVASMPEMQGVSEEELVERDPLDEIGNAEFRRFATIQEQRAANQRASLAAQLRLMGLRPEMTPTEKELRSVSLASIQPQPLQSQSELLDNVKQLSPMPEPRILRTETNSTSSPLRWPGGFRTSLVSFE